MSAWTSHSTGKLVLALAIGTATGYFISQPLPIRRFRAKLANAAANAGFDSLAKLIIGSSHYQGTSSNGTANSQRTSNLPEDADPDSLSNYRLAIVLRVDQLQHPSSLVAHSCRTILGLFKKLYKRKDLNLKLWEGGGQRIEVRVASSEAVLLAVQETARRHGIPTHAFADPTESGGKQRSIIAVGPAEKNLLWSVVGPLQEV